MSKAKSYAEFTLVNFLELAQSPQVLYQNPNPGAFPGSGMPPFANGPIGNAYAGPGLNYQPQAAYARSIGNGGVEHVLSRSVHLHPHIEEKESTTLSEDNNLTVRLTEVSVSQVWHHNQRVQGIDSVETKWVNDIKTITLLTSGTPVVTLVFTRNPHHGANLTLVELAPYARDFTIEVSHEWTIVDRREPAAKPVRRPRPVRQTNKDK